MRALEGLAECYHLGLCRGVGVCNFNANQLKEAYSAFRALGVPLVSNQVRYSIMNIEREVDGTIETCLELGVTPVAHTPLAGGLASGFYASALTGRRGRRGRVGRFEYGQLLALSHLFEAMGEVCEERSTEATPRTEAQVALRYVVAKGCVPIPGVNTAAQAREVAGALDFALDLAELETLDEHARTLHARRRELPWLKGL